jgi:hypothetical protein
MSYYQEHRKEEIARSKRYQQTHKEQVNAKNRRLYHKNKEKSVARGRSKRQKWLAEWLKILKDKGMTACIRCGYAQCFAAIDFHHVGPKKYEISVMLQTKPAPIKIAELDQVIPLCANCHREEHNGTKVYPRV